MAQVTLEEMEKMQREGLPLKERDSDIVVGTCRLISNELHPKGRHCIDWYPVTTNDN